MAIEHSCASCGTPLTKVRAPADPIYHFPVVVCPTCSLASVRRTHPIAAQWRHARRCAATAAGLLWRSALYAGLLLFGWIAVSTLTESIGNLSLPTFARMYADPDAADQIDRWRDAYGPAMLGLYAAWFIVFGAAITAAFAHVRRAWIPWCVMFAVLLGAPLLGSLIMVAENAAIVRSNEGVWQELRSRWHVIAPEMTNLALGLVLAPLGIPIGLRLRRAAARARQLRFKSALNRARKRKRLAA